MTTQELHFLRLLRAAVGSAPAADLPPSEETDWTAVFSLAESHHVLPMIVEAAYRAGAAPPEEVFARYKRRAMHMISLQAAKTAAFLSLYSFLAERGLAPLVMKGIICRALYPQPDFRFSADEDLLIPPDDIDAYHAALSAYGLTAGRPEEEISSAQETGYTSADGLLYLELHRYPFPPESGAYGDFNDAFAGVHDRAVSVTADGAALRTMCPTDHLFYLICHALKHFLHGGFGIRQICDICLFARAKDGEIDWARIRSQAEAIRAAEFIAAVFAVGSRYLGVEPPASEGARPLREVRTDPEPLLADLLDSGVFGASTRSRRHSGGITLGAVESAKKGASAGRGSLLRTLFPPASSLEGRYTYLKDHPILLPAAWAHRLVTYARQQGTADDSAAEALRIGRERTELLRRYGLLGGAPDRVVDTGEYISSLRELIEQGHEVALPVAGSSMTPFLGDGRDRVFLRAPDRPLKRGDIVLYRRDGGIYVLHRIRRVRGGTYDVVGDAQSEIERGVRREQIFAVVTRAERKGKLIGPGCFHWRFFQYVWIGMVPLRRPLLGLYAACRRNIRKPVNKTPEEDIK